MKEHKAATRSGELEKSAEHAWNHHHQIEWDEIKVLDEAANNTTLLIKEALHIRLTDTETLINRDEGVAISDCWTAILSHARPMTYAASSSSVKLIAKLEVEPKPIDQGLRSQRQKHWNYAIIYMLVVVTLSRLYLLISLSAF